jgi:CheY-like chemotaxis protein
MDYEMPIMTGPEAAEAMRNVGYEGPIVGITGNILSEDTDYFKSHGATEVLPKPVTMARIHAFWEQQERNSRRQRRSNRCL